MRKEKEVTLGWAVPGRDYYRAIKGSDGGQMLADSETEGNLSRISFLLFTIHQI